jgi:hypothetical protein
MSPALRTQNKKSSEGGTQNSKLKPIGELRGKVWQGRLPDNAR